MTKPIVLHPFLLALFTVLLLYSVNLNVMPIQETFRPATVVFCIVLLSWLFVCALSRKPAAAGIVVSLFLVVFLAYGYLLVIAAQRELTPWWGKLLRHSVFQWILILLALAAFWKITRINSSLAKITNLLNFGCACLVLFNVYPCIARAITAFRKPPVMESIQELPPRHELSVPRRHIFYIILDEYARSDVLEELFQYDNGTLVNFLNQKGFFVAEKSRANYCQTYPSLASSLNLVYLDSALTVADPESRDRDPFWKLIRKNAAARFLRSQGYQFVAFSSGMSFTEIPDADVHVKPFWALSNFEYVLLLTTPFGQLNWLSRLQLELHRQRILFAFEHLADLARREMPVFVFAHILAPHSPFVFGAHGERKYYDDGLARSFAQAAMGDRGSYVERYRAQLEFVTSKIQETIDAILANSAEPPIILLQSDHGSGSRYNKEDLSSTDLWERMSILNAYYLPGGGQTELYRSITPVNTFRVVFNRYFGTRYALLGDRSYFERWSRPYEFIEVTNKLDAINHDRTAGMQRTPESGR